MEKIRKVYRCHVTPPDGELSTANYLAHCAFEKVEAEVGEVTEIIVDAEDIRSAKKAINFGKSFAGAQNTTININ